MIKNNFNAQGYKAPVCKVVCLHLEGNCLQAESVTNGINGFSYDDEELGTN